MELNFSDMNESFARSASFAKEISGQLEESSREIAQAAQERIKREEKMVAGAEAIIVQNKILEKQVESVQKQNEILSNNYKKLEELYEAQVEANKEAKEELIRSRRFNIAMMIISIIAMLAAIAGPIVTILVSK